ncbi:UDP-2,4-diacetamido-2,4,6-trideoxy-beta-L-altropyranose hydrolase [Apibacter sp. HY039]|uniref:UDP-2,4-diacetamido-2,4, 6-trideoxy-beta-L-altropyranose hydrolase n=1 Tax=Apibacter sp. HY039 TaxID=2501476 RepID=UPI000FEB9D7A|nr:UDP-2,4-diacetamido-2,4,6-trideoxy-beta-L-altropyranose hydrolase [Apibacter sp. HY039]
MISKKIYIRVDGNTQIGLGHLFRCLALGEILKPYFEVTFFCEKIPDLLISQIKNKNFHFFLIKSENEFLSKLNGNVIAVLDNYFFNTEYQKKIKNFGSKLVCIDDVHDKEFYSDIVINPSEGVSKNDYSVQTYTKMFLGFQYALLRNEFLQFSGEKKAFPDNNNIFLCLGGGDINNITLKILKKLISFEKINICVGAAYLYLNELDDYIKQNNLENRVLIYSNISSIEIIKIMTESKISICSPSTVALEYLSVCKGKLYLVKTADNQKDFYEYSIRNNLADSIDNYFIGNHFEPNYQLQDYFFDGKQQERYFNIFNNLIHD